MGSYMYTVNVDFKHRVKLVADGDDLAKHFTFHSDLLVK